MRSASASPVVALEEFFQGSVITHSCLGRRRSGLKIRDRGLQEESRPCAGVFTCTLKLQLLMTDERQDRRPRRLQSGAKYLTQPPLTCSRTGFSRFLLLPQHLHASNNTKQSLKISSKRSPAQTSKYQLLDVTDSPVNECKCCSPRGCRASMNTDDYDNLFCLKGSCQKQR